jgi:UDP-N-acetylglucosamine diphosphorylase/glucosamine-1-phosphate N-acetyltransferase
MEDVGAVILAAGEGTRMRSNKAKVLHEIAGVPMICHVVQAALHAVSDVVVVVGHQAEAVRNVLSSYLTLRFALQTQQLGTGHAVMCAMTQIPKSIQHVVILCGDTPLIKGTTVRGLIDAHKSEKSDLTLLTTRISDPSGYGRIIVDNKGRLIRIVEEADATESERKIRIVNTGTYCIRAPFLRKALADLKNNNIQGEFYLTDVVESAHRQGRPALMMETNSAAEVMGVNTKNDLAEAERLLRRDVHGGGQ